MISKIPSFQTSSGEVFVTIEQAQTAEIGALLSGSVTVANIMANAAKIVDILTTTPRSLPSARKANGGRKPRRTKAEMAAAKAEQQLRKMESPYAGEPG